MQNIFDFIWNNWAIIVPILIALISEIMGANPNWKYNGVLDFLKGLLQGKKP